jgi:hypothetical protein
MAAMPTLFSAFSFMAVSNEVLDVGVWKLVWAGVINISLHCIWYNVGKSYNSSRDAEFYIFVHSYLLCTESVWQLMVIWTNKCKPIFELTEMRATTCVGSRTILCDFSDVLKRK